MELMQSQAVVITEEEKRRYSPSQPASKSVSGQDRLNIYCMSFTRASKSRKEITCKNCIVDLADQNDVVHIIPAKFHSSSTSYCKLKIDIYSLPD